MSDCAGSRAYSTKIDDFRFRLQYNEIRGFVFFFEAANMEFLDVGGDAMAVSYRKLWHLMLDKKVNKTGLRSWRGFHIMQC